MTTANPHTSSADAAKSYAIASHAAKIARYAAKGRAAIKAEAAELKKSLANLRRCPSAYRDGAVACVEGQLEDLREAWRLAK